MSKAKKVWLIIGLVVLTLALVAVLAFCGLTKWLAGEPVEETLGGDMTYTVQVKNAVGTPMEGIGVYIYEDETQQELVWFDKTNAEGQMSFTDAASNQYVAVLDGVPTGYAAEDFYPLTGELTEIVLAAQSMEDIDPDELRYKLGDLMLDFTITDVDGNEHTLSELLKTKKAVVLNFWYVECAPCKAEFPYMQAAYELYKKDLEILAMNPVNTDEAAVKAFRDELELTFPMAVVDEVWAQVMQLTAYPTTVVIDRYGNISLIHKGSIDSADTFEQLFEYFTSDDYVQRPIESIDEIVTKTEGTKENPLQVGGVTQFDITVQPEQTYYIEIYKLVADIYLTVEGEDFFVTYNGKEYKPSDGKATIFVEPEGTMTAVELQITNTSKKEQKYSVSLANPKGSYGNPYTMSLGEFDVRTSAGNEQGTYYVYTAEESGTLTLKCLSSSVKDYGFTLYNLRSYALRNTDSDAEKDEDGYTYVSVKVKKGDRIQFVVAVMPDSSRYIAAGSFKFLAELEAGDGEEDKNAELPKTTYTVTITDEESNPISGVVVNVKGEFTYVYPEEEDTEGENGTESGTETESGTDTESGTEGGTEEGTEPTEPKTEEIKVDVNLTTDENGTVTTEQVSGPYTATIRVPAGYKLENTKFDLTAEAPSVEVKLQKIVMKDYTVKVLYPDGEPVADTLVIVGSGVAYTDENGRVVFNLEEGQYSALVIGAPEDYVVPEDTDFAAGATTLVINLGYGPGHETNPIKLSGPKSLTTKDVSNGKPQHYEITGVGGSTLKVEGAVGAFVQLNGGEAVNADDSGNISISVPEDSDPLSLVVGTTGETAQRITVNFEYPLGTLQNPEAMTDSFKKMAVEVEAGDSDGYYWTKKANGTGTITFEFSTGVSASETCEVTLSSGGKTVKLSTDNKDAEVTLDVTQGQAILIHVVAIPNNGTYGALKFNLKGTTAFETEATGDTYSVNLKDADGTAQAGVKVQFVKDGTVVTTATTDENGVAEALLEAGDYTVSFVDETIIYDADKAVLTASVPAITLTISYSEEAVPEGMTRYSVSVADYLGNEVGNVVVLFVQDGSPKGYGIIEQVGASVTADLPTGTYNVQLAFLGGQELYYEETAAIVTVEKPSLEILVAGPNTAAEEENWSLGFVTPLQIGGVYVTTQPDIVNYYTFFAEEQGVYEFRVTDPNAVISFWGDVNYPADGTSEVEDYTKWAFTRSVNTAALGQNLVIGVTGTTDTILVVTRVGDAVEDVPYTEYVPETEPTEFTFSGQTLTYVDVKAASESYNLVYNETDGYYHIGSASGPILYLQIDANKKDPANPVAPPYIHLYKMVGGVDNTGTALRCVYTDSEGNKVKEDYTAAMLLYGECADNTYGIYPMTKDLLYMLQMGGGYQGWWDAEDKKGNLLFKDEEGVLDPTVNMEIAWMFACCYVNDGSVTVIPQTQSVSDEVENVDGTAPELEDQPEALPPEEEQLVPDVEEAETAPSDEEEQEEATATTETTEAPAETTES